MKLREYLDQYKNMDMDMEVFDCSDDTGTFSPAGKPAVMEIVRYDELPIFDDENSFQRKFGDTEEHEIEKKTVIITNYGERVF
jgi:hypothetical protein